MDVDALDAGLRTRVETQKSGPDVVRTFRRLAFA